MASRISFLKAKEKKLEKSKKKTTAEFKLEKTISKLSGKKYIGRR